MFSYAYINIVKKKEKGISLGLLKTYVKCATKDINYTKDFFKIQLNIEKEHIKSTEIRLIKKSKELYIDFLKTDLINVQYDMKKTWKIINTAIGKKATVRNPTIDHLTVDNQRVTSDDNVALEFNNYSVNIGKSLRNNSQRHSPCRKGQNTYEVFEKEYKNSFL